MFNRSILRHLLQRIVRQPWGDGSVAGGRSGSARLETVEPRRLLAAQVVDQWFDYEAMQGISIQFDQDVSSSLDSLEVTAWNAETSQQRIAELADYDASTHVATFSLTSDGGAVIQDGNYTTEVSWKDGSGSGADLDVPPSLQFFFKQGDITRDRQVDFFDFLTLRGNYGMTSGATFSDGDLNYDGRVDFFDFLTLRAQYGESLAEPLSPLVITTGGTYSGSWQSLDPAVPAVLIRTSEPVILEDATLRGRGDLIRSEVQGANLTVRNVEGYGLNPGVHGQAPGRFLYAFDFANVVVEDSYLEGTAGIKLLEYAGDYSPANTVTIVGNSALNIDGRKSDGNGGWLDFNKRTRLSDGLEEKGL